MQNTVLAKYEKVTAHSPGHRETGERGKKPANEADLNMLSAAGIHFFTELTELPLIYHLSISARSQQPRKIGFFNSKDQNNHPITD